jgi:hypothetical protein
MSPDKALGPEGVLALQFLDRRQGEWYCTTCWATAVGVDARILERLAERMATLEAVTAGYQAWAGGPCKVCDESPAGVAQQKALRSVRSLGRTP